MNYQPPPKLPSEMDPLAVEILEKLRRFPEAPFVVLGGYFALKHYVDYRPTHDIDAWWNSTATTQNREETLSRLRDIMQEIAERHQLEFAERKTTQSGVASLLLKRNGKAIFSWQIAPRTVEIDAPIESPWSPILIETLRDNMASKMTALVERGAPRDFRDVYVLASRGITTVADMWALWKQKNPSLDVRDAKAHVLKHLVSIEMRRPIEAVEPERRAAVAKLREWVRSTLTSCEYMRQRDSGMER